ncbi:hypothetical protein ACSBR2_005893 [Camellia fascicularis]
MGAGFGRLVCACQYTEEWRWEWGSQGCPYIDQKELGYPQLSSLFCLLIINTHQANRSTETEVEVVLLHVLQRRYQVHTQAIPQLELNCVHYCHTFLILENLVSH